MKDPHSKPKSRSGRLKPIPREDLGPQNATGSAFVLPPRILKNLTPVSQPNARLLNRTLRQAQHLINHQRKVLERTKRLQERSYTVSKRVENARLAQKMAIHAKATALARSLKSADTRRKAHLQVVRKRAKASFKSHLQASRAASGTSESQNPVPEPKESASPAIDGSMEEYWPYISGIRLIQRRIRRFLLFKNVEHINTTRILPLLASPLNIGEELLAYHTRSESGIEIEGLLAHLNLPDITKKGSYNSFKYAYIIIYEFFCFVENSVHPSFHSSHTQEHNLAAKALPVLLLKTSTAVVNGLVSLLEGPFPDLANPFSEPRLLFNKLWKAHHFFFLCFKEVHLENCRAISEEASSIISQQMAILEGFPELDAIEGHQKLLEKNTSLLNLAKQKASRPDWLDLGLSYDDVILQIQQQTANKLGAKYDSASIDEDFFSLYNSRSKCVRLGALCTYLPPHISGTKWRAFWLQKFQKSESEVSKFSEYNIPLGLKSGRWKFASKTDLEECYKFGMEEIAKNYASKTNLHLLAQLEAVEEGMERIVHSAHQYVLLKNEKGTYSKKEIYKLARSGILTCSPEKDAFPFSNRLRSFNEKAKTLKVFSDTMFPQEGVPEVPQISIISETSRKETFVKISDDLAAILTALEQIEVKLFVRWAGDCGFQSFRDFKAFENGIRLLSYKNLSLSKGTNSPQLRFPNMYHFIALTRPQMEETVIKNHTKMVDAFTSSPAITGSPSLVKKTKAFDFFKGVFAGFVTADIHLPVSEKLQKFRVRENELLDLFTEELSELAAKAHHLVVASVVVAVLQSCTNAQAFQIARVVHERQKQPNAVFSSGFASGLIESLGVPLPQRHFAASLLNNELAAFQAGTSLIAHVLASRARELLSAETLAKSRRAARALRAADGNTLVEEFSRTCTHVYEVYNPLLNWIHGDLGEL